MLYWGQKIPYLYNSINKHTSQLKLLKNYHLQLRAINTLQILL